MMNYFMHDIYSKQVQKQKSSLQNEKLSSPGSPIAFSSAHSVGRLTGHVAILETDDCGFISKWPSKAEQLFGYEPNEIIGKHIAILYTDQALRSGQVVHELQTVDHRGALVSYSWLKRKDGDRLWTYSECHALKDAFGKLLGYRKYIVEASNS